MATPASGEINTELNPEDKNWMPKRRVSFLLPSFVAAGDFRVHVMVRDLVAKSEVSRDLPFRIGGVQIQPSSTVAIENFHFLRHANDAKPLELAAYAPGDKVFARFVMTGYRSVRRISTICHTGYRLFGLMESHLSNRPKQRNCKRQLLSCAICPWRDHSDHAIYYASR